MKTKPKPRIRRGSQVMWNGSRVNVLSIYEGRDMAWVRLKNGASVLADYADLKPVERRGK